MDLTANCLLACMRNRLHASHSWLVAGDTQPVFECSGSGWLQDSMAGAAALVHPVH